ncbi:MAG: SUF system NifU family Fe-S cluster assembly protein [Gemmatimonadota bacterium]
MPLSADVPPPVPVSAPLSPDPGVASLYQEIILSHYRAPQHKGALRAPTATVEHRNPLCGDVLTLQLQQDGDRIVDAAFSARACSITQATASMLLHRVIGGTVADALAVMAQIERLLDGPAAVTAPELEALGDLRSLASVARFPARKACVRLVTGAISEAVAR